MIVSTKKYIATHKRLKPAKILIPHSLNASPTLSVCLIVPNPQKDFKEILTHVASTSQHPNRIGRIIDIKKLEKKYHSFESKRQLRGSYDLFLADDRIITYLPKIMGKTFYLSTSKRPIPVCLRPRKLKEESRNALLPMVKPKKTSSESTSIVGPSEFVQEIERTLSTTTVNLSPSSTTAVRVGLASFTSDQLAQNIEAVIGAMVDKSIPKKWRGLKAIHVKGPNSMALPIWLAEELWEDETEVLEESAIKQRRLEPSPRKRRPATLEEQPEKRVESTGGNQDMVHDQSKGRSKRRRTDDKDPDLETKEQREQLRQHRKGVREKLKNQE